MSDLHYSLLSYGWYSGNSRGPRTEWWTRSLPTPHEPPAHAQGFGGECKYVWFSLSSVNWDLSWISKELISVVIPFTLGRCLLCSLRYSKSGFPITSLLYWPLDPSLYLKWSGRDDWYRDQGNKTKRAVEDLFEVWKSKASELKQFHVRFLMHFWNKLVFIQRYRLPFPYVLFRLCFSPQPLPNQEVSMWDNFRWEKACLWFIMVGPHCINPWSFFVDIK